MSEQGIWFEGRFIPFIGGGTGIEIAALAVAAIGAGVAAYGAYQGAEAQKEQLKANETAKKLEAQAMEDAGKAAAARQRKKDSYALSSFAARAGAAGVIARQGSSLMAELDYAEQSELEAQHVQHGYQVGAAKAKTAASFNRWQADRISPMTEAGKSLLSSTGSIAGSYATAGASGAATQRGGGLTARPNQIFNEG